MTLDTMDRYFVGVYDCREHVTWGRGGGEKRYTAVVLHGNLYMYTIRGHKTTYKTIDRFRRRSSRRVRGNYHAISRTSERSTQRSQQHR